MKFLLPGVLLISFAPILVKASTLSPVQAAFWRMFFGALFLILLMGISRQRFELAPKIYPSLILAGLFFGADLYLWHACIHMIGPGLATLLANCQIFFVMGLGSIFFKEKIHSRTLLAVFLGAAGLWLIFGFNQGNNYPLLGLLMGIGAGFSYAGYLIFLKHSSDQTQGENTLNQMLVICLSCSLLMVVLLLFQGEFPSLPNRLQGGIMVLYGVMIQGIAWIWLAKGSQQVTSIQTSLILLTQPVLALAWDILWFGHPIFWNEMLGVCLVLGAVFLSSQFQPQAKKPPEVPVTTV